MRRPTKKIGAVAGVAVRDHSLCPPEPVVDLGDLGRHARSAVGVYRLPLNFAVEVDAVVEIA